MASIHVDCGRKLALLAALLASANAESYRFRVYGEREGLGSPIIRAIEQDKNGYLWIATADGVFRFDGERMTRIGEGNNDKDIRWIHATAGGGVWLRTKSQLLLYANGAFGVARQGQPWTLDGYNNSAIQTITSTPSGEVWALSPKQLYRWKDARSPPERMAEDPRGLWSVSAATRGREILAGCGDRLCRWNEGGWSELAAPPDRYAMIHEDRRGNVYARGRKHILVRRAGSTRFEEIGSGLPPLSMDQPAPALAVDFHGRLLTNTGAGMARLENGRWAHITSRNGLPSDVVRALLVDREGGIWVGSMFQGLARWLGDGAWRIFDTSDGLPARGPRSATVTADGAVWVNARAAGLYRGTSNTSGHIQFRKMDGFPVPFEVSAGCCGELLIGAEGGGLFSYSERTGLREAAGFPRSAVVNAFDARYPDRIVAATSQGLFRQEPHGRWIPLVSGYRLFSASWAQSGAIWLGSDQGVILWRDGEARRIERSDAQPTPEVAVIHESSTGIVWVTPRRHPGLSAYRFENGRLVRILDRSAPALGARGPITFVQQDNAGHVLAAGGAGVDILKGERWHHFGLEQGLPVDLVFDVWARPDGTAWLSTGGGLVRYDPPREFPANDPPATVIHEVSSRFHTLSLHGRPEIPAAEADLTVSFSVLSTDVYAPPGVRYRLRRADGWRQAPGRRLEFASLAPGLYELQLAAQGRDGTWYPEPAAFAFSVAPPLWQTNWFRALCAAGVLGLLFLGQRWYSTRERERNLRRVQAMIDRYPGAAVMLDSGGRVMLVNQYVEDLVNKDRATIIGRTPEEALGPDLAAQWIGSKNERAASRINSVLHQGEIKYFDVRSFEIESASPDAASRCYFATDVTDWARAEAARTAAGKQLEEAHERYRSFIANSTEAIWRIEYTTPVPLSLPEEEFIDACYERAFVAEVNDVAVQHTSHSSVSVVGRRYGDIRDRYDPVNRDADLAWYRGGCQMRDYMTVRRGPDGKQRAFLTNIYSVVKDGLLIRSWGIQREITEGHRLQELIVSTAKGVSAQTGTAFFESLVEHLACMLEAACTYVATADQAENGELRTLAIWCDGRLREPRSYSLEGTPCQLVLHGGKTYTIASDVSSDFPDSSSLARLGVQAYVGTPLLDRNGAAIGLIVVMFRRALEQPELIRSTLDIFAARASAEIQRLAVEEELKRHERQLRALASHNQRLIEQERAHLAREIHDELGQQLTAIKIEISRARRLMQRQTGNADGVLKGLDAAVELTDETARSVRRLSTQLRPPGLDSLGLAAAIRWYAKEVAGRSGLSIDCNIEDLQPDPEIAVAVFRLAQESLTNVVRHAQATQVGIRLALRGDRMELSVADDGRGFDTSKPSDSLGLLGMQERTLAAGGTLSIRSSQDGTGTTVSASIPFVPARVAAGRAAP